jgi:hypothetical protein
MASLCDNASAKTGAKPLLRYWGAVVLSVAVAMVLGATTIYEIARWQVAAKWKVKGSMATAHPGIPIARARDQASYPFEGYFRSDMYGSGTLYLSFTILVDGRRVATAKWGVHSCIPGIRYE